MPKVTEGHREQMRERLIEAARECLATRGYDGTSARDILLHAGVSAGTLYNYFDSKEELFAAVADRFGESVRPSEVAGDPDQALASLVSFNFVGERDASVQPALRVKAAHDKRIASALRRYDESVQDAVRPLLEQAQNSKALRPDLDIDALIELVAICFEGLESRMASDGLLTSRRRIAGVVLELLALGAATPRSRLRDRLNELSREARAASSRR